MKKKKEVAGKVEGETVSLVSIKPAELEPASSASVVQRTCRGGRLVREVWHNSTILYLSFTNTRSSALSGIVDEAQDTSLGKEIGGSSIMASLEAA
ncbi:hypothetical protein AV530_016605 [Patagioenas fasciata monilis]|uniref:Uncharacterized protein n=1 Tax=Patagioenas fasciata monilis TaxID=372326 RepID=A0A1V4J318_PATFA|nr:hypothetical protein AV530_016605 [Patagioenas fasciata monilis]